MSLKDEILKAHTAPRNLVPLVVPEWGGMTVYLCEPTAGRADQLTAYQRKAVQVNVASAVQGFRARVAIMVLCDENGKPLFSAADEQALQNGSSAALDRIFNAAKPWLGGEEDVEEEAKNSQATGEDDSSSV